jgi:hypothetical protein
MQKSLGWVEGFALSRYTQTQGIHPQQHTLGYAIPAHPHGTVATGKTLCQL